jgi:hypothetical protein
MGHGTIVNGRSTVMQPRLIENGRPLEPERIMDLWINGIYFHNDRRKAQAINRLAASSVLSTRLPELRHLRHQLRGVSGTGDSPCSA